MFNTPCLCFILIIGVKLKPEIEGVNDVLNFY